MVGEASEEAKPGPVCRKMGLAAMARARGTPSGGSGAFLQLVLLLGLFWRHDDRAGSPCHRCHPLVHEFDVSTCRHLHRRASEPGGGGNTRDHLHGHRVSGKLSRGFTVGYKAMRYAPANDQMKQFHGSKARLDMGREGYALYQQSEAAEIFPTIEKRRPGSFESATRSHIRNFMECVQSRKDPNATVEMGQQTSVVLAMALEALRSGRRVKWNGAAKRVES